MVGFRKIPELCFFFVSDDKLLNTAVIQGVTLAVNNNSHFIPILIHPLVLYYTEYKRSITVRHNPAIFVIHCYMFWLKEISQALCYTHLKKRKLLDHYALLVSQI